VVVPVTGQLGEPGNRRPIEDLRFVVVGGYVADCIVNTPRLPVWGETYQAQSIRTSPGGKALNQAVALARLGAQVTAVGAVGDDPLGQDIIGALMREGIDVAGLQARTDAATAICVCFVGEDGQTSFVWRIGDEVAVAPETVRAATAAIEQADAVLMTFEMPAESVSEAIRAGNRGGTQVFVQPAPAFADPADAKSLPWELVDVLVPNETEARALLSGTDAAGGGLAQQLSVDFAVPTVVVTLGEQGCTAHAGGLTHRYPAEKVTAVDGIGGSDAFTAALAAHITSGALLEEAVDAAQSAASWAVSRPGGHESMPHWTKPVHDSHSPQ
jgi:ribokinase